MYFVILATSVATLIIFLKLLSQRRPRITKSEPNSYENQWNYQQIKEMLQYNKINLPVMLIDLDVFENNAKRIVNISRRNGKQLRIATKSIRCPYLIKIISDIGAGTVSGFMCYSVGEAEFLYEQGHNDFFIPYPTVLESDIEMALTLVSRGAKICLTVDSVDQVMKIDEIIDKMGKKNVLLRLCIDLDMSFKLGPIQLGAHRSNISTVEMFYAVAKTIKTSKYLILAGCMGYEASVAGLPDNNPHSSIPNFMIRLLKKLFYKNCTNFRANILKYCFKNEIELEFFNAGGSGNIEQVSKDTAVTEITAGSAFTQAQLFDYFVDNKCAPACCFALQCTRVNPNYIVCQSGGFIASGPVSNDKYPVPFNNPYKLKHFSDEGYGEVQTPLQIVGKCRDEEVSIGDPILFRPAKSGEIAEHFNTYLIKRNNKIIDTVKTYRGHGKIFY